MNGWGYKILSGIASLALMITTLNVSSTCLVAAHQPVLPEKAKMLKK